MAFFNRAKGLTGLNPLAYMGQEGAEGGNTTVPVVCYPDDPGPTDWQNFNLMCLWLNTTNNNLWYLASLSGNQALWLMLSGGKGNVISLTGNIPSPAVFPLAGNINVIGDGVGITIQGNAGTHTLTASLVGGGIAAQSFVTDLGTAVPTALGVLNVLATPTAGSSVQFNGQTANTIKLIVTDALSNTIVGFGAGKSGITGTVNTGFGTLVLDALTTGGSNCAFGANALGTATTSSQNCAFGNAALFAVTTGVGRNVAMGLSAAQQLTTGNNNVAIGYGALNNNTPGNGPFTCANVISIGSKTGSAYSGAESSNILLDSLGVNGESGAIHIGTQSATSSTYTSCSIAGISGTAVASPNAAVFIDGNGNLGTGVTTGTWTPTLKFGGSATGITYGVQQGSVTQIGNIVYFSAVIVLTSKGAQSGSASITGLPTSAAASPAAQRNGMFGTATGPSMPAGTTAFQTSITASTAILDLQAYGSTAASTLADTNFANNTSLYIQGFYFSA